MLPTDKQIKTVTTREQTAIPAGLDATAATPVAIIATTGRTLD